MRCSTDEDRQAVDTQLDKCVYLAKVHGAEYDIVREYSSAWNKPRPLFQKCLATIEKYDLWISYDLDRFSRDNPHIANEYLNLIVHKKGVRFLTINDNIDSNDEIKWNIVRHIMVWQANKYSERLSNRIKEGIKYKRKSLGSKYKHGRVRKCNYDRIRALFKKGVSISEIARILNINKGSVANAIKGMGTQTRDSIVGTQKE